MPLDFFSADHALYDRPQGIPLLNRDSPQARGLVGWWPLTWDIRDYSGRNNHGVGDQQGTGSIPTHTILDVGGVVDFEASSTTNGGSVQADFSLLNIGADGPISMAIWLEIETILSTGVELCFSIGDDVANQSIFLGYRNVAGGQWQWQVWSGTNVVSGTPTLTAGARVLLAGTYDGATMRLFVDGIERSSGAESVLSFGSGSPDVRIAGRPSDGNALLPDNKMWDARIWNRVLAPAEMWALYHPTTRWDLYWQPRIMVPGFVAAAGVAGRRLMNTPLNFGFMR